MKTKTFLLTITTVILFAQLKGQSIEVSGEINIPTTWSDTIYLTGDVTLKADLTINAGTKVLAKGYFGIFIENKGSITAEGSHTDSIFFTSNDTTGYTTRANITTGSWKGIQLQNVDESFFSYCSFSFGKSISDSQILGGGMINASQVQNLTFENCRFNRNYTTVNGGALNLYYCKATIKSSQFSDNEAFRGGAVYSGNSYVTQVEKSIFVKNRAGWGSAIYFGRSSGVDSLINSYIAENESSAICIYYTSPIIINSVISNNSGPGISSNDTEFKLINSNITNNKQDMILSDSSSPYFINSIIWDNGIDNRTPDLNAPLAYNCCIQGGNAFDAYVYQSCIETDPLFVNSTDGNYALSSSSPCIDSGDTTNISNYLPKTDFAENIRIWNSKIDIGAYEYIPDNEISKSILLTGNMNFGIVKIDSSKTINLTIKNNGNSSFDISNVEMPNNFSAEIGNILLYPNDSICLAVTFTPTSVQEYNGTITINGDFTSGTNTVNVSGVGGKSVIRLSENLQIDSTLIGSSSFDTLTIYNDGNFDLNITDIEMPDDFTPDWKVGKIPANDSQKVVITFTPTLAQDYNGTITINGDFTSGTNTVNISGVGVSSTSITNNIYQDEINIFPNPFNEKITISSSNNIRKIDFISIDGKTIFSVDSPQKIIDTSILPKGFYILNIVLEKTTITKKIMKN